jgi:NTE family protein
MTVPAYGSTEYLPDGARSGVALCLSGGGFRAPLFHLGALRRLNEYGVLSQIDTISSVSGGSILSAHLADRIREWPAPGGVIPHWEDQIAAPFRQFTGRNLRTWLPLLGFAQQLLPFNVTRGSATNVLAKRYERSLTRLRFPELPTRPRFIICTTDLVFGVHWVFDSAPDGQAPGGVGDYQAGYLRPAPSWSVARTVAASSCFPPFFPPMPIGLRPNTLTGGRYSGQDRQTLVKSIGFTDGGVYDNFGLEPVWKDKRVVMVSDGGGIFKAARRGGFLWCFHRYLAVTSEQERAVRKRWLISNFIAGQAEGAYWGIGSACDHYGTQTRGYSESLAQDIVAELRTDLDAFSPAEAAVLENHGYLLADAAIQAHLGGGAIQIPTPAPALTIPHPEWMDETKVRRALASSARCHVWGRR